MPVLVIGGEPAAKDEEKPAPKFGKKPIKSIGGDPEKDTESEEESGGDRDEQMSLAAKEILSAIESSNSKKLKTALEAFCLACDDDEEEE